MLHTPYTFTHSLSPLTLLAVEPGVGAPSHRGRLWHRRSLCSDVYTIFHIVAEPVDRVAIGW